MTAWEIVFTVLAVLAVILVILYFIGRRLQKKQDEASVVMEQNKQVLSALIIDKKKMKMKDANFPASALAQVPWYMRNGKFPMAKVKVGPQITTLICDPSVFKALPVKKIVKIEVAGAYITSFSTAKKGEKKPEPPKKPTFKEKIKKLFTKKNK